MCIRDFCLDRLARILIGLGLRHTRPTAQEEPHGSKDQAQVQYRKGQEARWQVHATRKVQERRPGQARWFEGEEGVREGRRSRQNRIKEVRREENYDKKDDGKESRCKKVGRRKVDT